MTLPKAKPSIDQIRPHMSGLPQGFTADTIKLCSNESAFGPSPATLATARTAINQMARYAEQGTGELQQAIADVFELDPARIVCGPGSDELLSRLCRAYLSTGDELIYSANGYAKFANYALANDAIPVKAPDRELVASVDAILDKVSDRTRMVTLANPDNPTGTFVDAKEIARLHRALPPNVLLVLDSAYTEYVDDDSYENPASLVERSDNVVMTRTFSKIFGMAGLRLGWLYGPAHVVDVLRRIGLTFPVSNVALDCGIVALQDSAHTASVFKRNQSLKAALYRDMAGLGLKTVPSQTNFVLVDFSGAKYSAEQATGALWKAGIMVRRFPSPALASTIRVTIGNEEQMALFTDTLRRFMQS